MKIVNIMNFVRQIDEREENSTENLLKMTKAELELVNEYKLPNTFLLQYDALCDDDFVSLFKSNEAERTELGLWYEIVEPLTAACDIPYNSEMGWKWDWHIIPGFSMAYTPKEREQLIDEAMRKFKEVFGYFPKTVASWLIDTHTVNYLCDNYDIDALAICRDQRSTDAYTLVGGYFNQGYYPSKNNIFTPAQTKDNQVDTPVFRLLGPCPLLNYDNLKYASTHAKENVLNSHGCYTLEPVWTYGSTPEIVDWTFKTYFENEDLGFSYAHIGQENSFYNSPSLLPALKMQIDKLLKIDGIEFKKMGDTGAWFKNNYSQSTPATSVCALDSWDENSDVQSVYYNCKNYTANLFRYDNNIFIRSLFLFDERIKDKYIEDKCTTFDAIYENLPIVDTALDERKICGIVIDSSANEFTARKIDDNVLQIEWDNGKVVFYQDKIEIYSNKIRYYNAVVEIEGNTLKFEHNGVNYYLDISNAEIIKTDSFIEITTDDCLTLTPRRES